MRAAWIAKKFDGKASHLFRLAAARALRDHAGAADDLAPFYTSGRGGPGVYLVNTYDLPPRPLYNLTALTLHESAPGHAFQMPLAAEDKTLPDFRRYTYISAYGEGWALYCEQLGDEMGMYETPYDRFGMLGYQMWRAARLVVDTGIHSQGWTREQAIAYMRDNTALARSRDRDRSRSLHRLAGAGAVLLSRRDGDPESARAKPRQRWAPSSTSAPSTTRCLQLGSVPLPVLEGAHRPLHRRRRQRPVSRDGIVPLPCHRPACPGTSSYGNQGEKSGTNEETEVMAIDFEIPAEAKAIRERCANGCRTNASRRRAAAQGRRLQDRARRTAREGARAGPVVSVHPEGIRRHGAWPARQCAGADGAGREPSRRAVDEHAGSRRRDDADLAAARHRLSEREIPQAAAERREAHLLFDDGEGRRRRRHRHADARREEGQRRLRR